MFKKVSLVFFSTLWCCSVFLFVYRIVEPDTATDVSPNLVSSTISDANPQTLMNTADSVNEIKYYYFCTVEHQDCTYMNETVLKNLAQQMNVESFDFLEFVDVETLYSDWTPAKLKSVWGFENYPALVAAKDLGNSFEILNAIEWVETVPLDEQSVKDWMILNNLWTGTIEDKGEVIDKPIDEQ